MFGSTKTKGNWETSGGRLPKPISKGMAVVFLKSILVIPRLSFILTIRKQAVPVRKVTFITLFRDCFEKKPYFKENSIGHSKGYCCWDETPQ